MGNLILLSFAVLTGVLALFVVFARSTIGSALSLVGVMVLLAAIYALIGANLIAALQIIVYAGAVMVLFVFSIMLLNQNEHQTEINWRSYRAWIYIGIVVVVCSGLVKLVLLLPTLTPVAEGTFQGGDVEIISQALFTDYIFHFEVLSLILLIGIVSALVVARRRG